MAATPTTILPAAIRRETSGDIGGALHFSDNLRNTAPLGTTKIAAGHPKQAGTEAGRENKGQPGVVVGRRFKKVRNTIGHQGKSNGGEAHDNAAQPEYRPPQPDSPLGLQIGLIGANIRLASMPAPVQGGH
jgi:hypothetical protein